MKNKYLMIIFMIVYCVANSVVADSNKSLNLDAKTEVELLPGFEPCMGVKSEDRFNDINCQDKETVDSLVIKNNETQHQVIEDKVQPKGNILKKSFKPLVN